MSIEQASMVLEEFEKQYYFMPLELKEEKHDLLTELDYGKNYLVYIDNAYLPTEKSLKEWFKLKFIR